MKCMELFNALTKKKKNDNASTAKPLHCKAPATR